MRPKPVLAPVMSTTEPMTMTPRPNAAEVPTHRSAEAASLPDLSSLSDDLPQFLNHRRHESIHGRARDRASQDRLHTWPYLRSPAAPPIRHEERFLSADTTPPLRPAIASDIVRTRWDTPL